MKKKETRAEVLAKARQVIGEYLRAIREHRGLNQTELADSVGLRQADIEQVHAAWLCMPYARSCVQCCSYFRH